jgi:glycosyltransferase involved in cell wall biosynthesis
LDPSEHPKYSVVVPVYESDRSIEQLVERTALVFEGAIRSSFEIILIDDGSRKSATWETLSRLAYDRPHQVIAIRLTRNYGKAAAVLCGIRVARGDWVITIDDDLQQRPEDIPLLTAHESHDVVVANFGQRFHGRLAVLASAMKSWFDRAILGVPCRMTPLKLIRGSIARGIAHTTTNRPFIPALLAHVTSDFKPVVVTHQPSHHGRTRYNVRRRLRQFSDLLIGNSNLVLRCVGTFGALVAVMGMVYAVYIVIRRLFGTIGEPGWATIVAINLVFGGLTLITLGIIGEYLIRILDANTGKPPYVIREVIGAAHVGSGFVVRDQISERNV